MEGGSNTIGDGSVGGEGECEKIGKIEMSFFENKSRADTTTRLPHKW